jgi:anti-sigma factor RsiW
MNAEDHLRARRLMDAREVEGIADAERHWLEDHLEQCPQCEAGRQANQRALQLLRSNSLVVDPQVVSATQARIRWRARELRENQARLRVLWISCGLSWVMGTVTAPLLWRALGWLGQRFDVSQAVRVELFTFCWIVPATVTGALLVWRNSHAASPNGDFVTSRGKSRD